MAELIASRYASALFSAGEDLEKIETFYEESKALGTIFREDENLLSFLSHPKVNKREKKELITNVFGERISKEIINFLYILIDKNREKDFPEITKIYEDLYYEHEGILRVVAVTAMPMKEEAQLRLKKVLGEKLNKKIKLKNQIDESTIGGVKLEVEGKLVDGTIKGKLETMSRTFRAATN